MKTIQQDVLEVAVYDENGNFLNKLNLTKEVKLRTEQEKHGEETYLYVSESVQDINMLELLGEKIIDNKSDFDKDSFTTPDVNIIRFSSKPETTRLKVVGTGIDYSLETAEVEHDIKIVFPNVELVKQNSFTFGSGEVYQPTYRFRVSPFNDQGDLYEMQFKKRQI